MYKLITMLILTLLVTSYAFGDEFTSPELVGGINISANECINSEWPTSSYTSETRGEVVLYKVPTDYTPTVTNLACITSIEFLSRINNIPSKAVVGIITEDFSRSTLVQWNLVDDYMLLIDINIPTCAASGVGTFIKYPQPLARIKEVITRKPFPTAESLPPHLKSKIKSNLTKATREDLIALFK